ncbi:hypothetical protein [Bradyrhizobium sp. 76]|uniref:hypothetical protein n=1 Tax=Bradyrhizobium sp. 76 TaxID=2782680 RepID=UPI001FFA5C3A|nr:hypothetical protein [Bradyrhizobium sp. 76]MCK1406138.1 hypothetical protein [Bradyrhizobium sp. 76]
MRSSVSKWVKPDNQSLFVQLSSRDLTENVIGDRFSGLDLVAMIQVRHLLEHDVGR